MNKQFYRTKFNVKLGTYVAVSELAKSHNGDTSPRVASSTKNIAPDSRTDTCELDQGQRTLRQLVLALSMLMSITPVYADVTVNPSANAAYKPTVLKAGETANVWISTPSASGVSRNSYSQFDADQNGVILNNARTATTSKITATSIAANPNLAQGAAKTIVNEVVSANPSLLRGNVEVLGSKANIVIANPSGITVNGGGFINANQVTLSTGTLAYNSDGSIKQHTVKQGVISINPDANNRGLGGNGNNPAALELLGRSIAVNAPVNATTITAVSGTNTMNADTGEFTNITGTGTKPTLALDVAQLGGLYANSIYLYANEAGIGVNNAGVIKAKNNLVLNSNGKVTNAATGLMQTTDATSGLMSVQTNRTDSHGDLVNQGKLHSANSLFVEAGRNLSLQQDSYTGVANTASKGIVSINAPGSITITGAHVRQFGSDQDIYISAGNSLSVTGTLSDGTASNIRGNGSSYIQANNTVNVNGGLITARHAINIASTNKSSYTNASLASSQSEINLLTTGTDPNNTALTINNSSLDAKTKLVAQSAGDLNMTKLTLPQESATSTKARVQDVILAADRNLNLNQNDKKLEEIKGNLTLQAGEKATLKTNLTGTSTEIKTGLDIHVNARNIETRNFALSGNNIDLTAQNAIRLDTDSRLTVKGDVDVSALSGNMVVIQPNISAGKTADLIAKGRVQLITSRVETEVAGTTLKNANYTKGTISGKTGVNIHSLENRLDIDPTTITSTAGDVALSSQDSIVLYAKANEAVTQNTDGSFKSTKSYIGSNVKANNVDINNKTAPTTVAITGANTDVANNTSRYIFLDKATIDSTSGNLNVNSNNALRLLNTNLSSAKNMSLSAKGNVPLTLNGVTATAKQNMALSSQQYVYFNAEADARKDANGVIQTGTNGGIIFDPKYSSSKVNLTADGTLSIYTGYAQFYKNSNLNAGALLIESTKSHQIFDTGNTWNARGSDFLRNAQLNDINGALSIYSGKYDIIVDPKKLALSADGNIDIRAAGGNLTFVGYGGTTGNGSEQVVKLNTANGGINLQGQNVKLQGTQLTANKDINIISTAGDVVVDGVKNTVTNLVITPRLNEAKNAKSAIEKRIVELDNEQYKKDLAEEEKWFQAWDDEDLRHGNTKLAVFFWERYREASSKVSKTRNELANLEIQKTGLVKEIEFYGKGLNGYEHASTKLKTTNGNINLASSKGISISGATIDASKGTVNLEATGTLAGSGHQIQGIYQNSQPNSVKQGNIKGSIIIDATQNSYESGITSDANYAWRSPVNPTTINGVQGVNIQAKGQAATDNLILQGVNISSTGDVNIEAYKNIVFDVAIDNSYDKSTKTETKRKWYGKKTTTTTVATSSQSNGVSVDITGKNINIKSQENNTSDMTGKNRTSIDMYSSQLTANGGNISIQAGGDLNFLTADDVVQNTVDISKKSSWIGITLNKSNSTSTRNIKSELPAVLRADYIGTKSGLDTRLKGTEFYYLEGATIQAGGTISLEGANTLYQNTYKKDSNSVVWQSMQDKGSITETMQLPKFNGPVVPKFSGSLTVQVPVESRTASQKELISEVEKLAKTPGNAYLKSLLDNKNQQVNWQEILLTNEQWDYKSQGLTAAGAALLAIIVAAATAGAGAAALGTTSAVAGGGTVTTFGGMTLATTTAAGMTTYTATGAIVNAALTSLATQASISAVNNGGNLGKVLEDIGSKDSVKSLVTSVITVGLMDKLNTSLDLKLDNPTLTDRALNNFVQGVGSTLISTSIQGGNLSDNLEKALLAGLSSTIQGQLSTKIKGLEDVDYLLHKIAHAAAGCVAGALQKSCEAGAIGAAVGEIVASSITTPNNFNTFDELAEHQRIVRELSKLTAGVIAAYAGYDVYAATNSAETAVRNNRQLHEEEIKRIDILAKGDSGKKDRLTIAACALIKCSAGLDPNSVEYKMLIQIENLGNTSAYKVERDLLKQQKFNYDYTFLGYSVPNVKGSDQLFQYTTLDTGWDTASRFDAKYSIGTRAGGVLMIAGGVAGGAVSTGGLVTCATGIGCIVAGTGLVTSADIASTGLQQLVQGKSQNTLGAMAISEVTGISLETAESLYGLLNMGTTIQQISTGLKVAAQNGVTTLPKVENIQKVCSGTACFIAGTLIETNQGLKRIEDFVGGELVWSKDELTQEYNYRPVIGTKRTENQSIYKVVVKDQRGIEETLYTTEEHPFWIKDQGWLKAALLQSGMKLLDRNNMTLNVISQEKLAYLDTVYNIEVDEYHTYHVGTLGVWVHNADCCNIVQKKLKYEIEVNGDSFYKKYDISTRQLFDKNGIPVDKKFETSYLYSSFNETKGEFYIEKMAAFQSGHYTGREMLSVAIERIGLNNIKMAKAQLADTNKAAFQTAMSNTGDPLKAVAQTPLGKAMSDLGFNVSTVRDINSSLPWVEFVRK